MDHLGEIAPRNAMHCIYFWLIVMNRNAEEHSNTVTFRFCSEHHSVTIFLNVNSVFVSLLAVFH